MTKHFLSIASIVFFCLSVISCSDNDTDRKLILDFDQSTKRYGYVDSLGNVVIPYQYYSAEEFVDGYAKVKDLKHYGIINQSGKAVLPLAYTLIEDFQHGVAFASTWVDHENKYALINRKGELLTPAKYDRVRDFSEDLAVTVIDGMNPIHIFIDTLGNEVLKSDYPEVYPFHDGMARVGSSWNCIFGYIDKTGKEVIPLKYGDATDFSEGLAAVKQNSRWGYIDTKGNTVIPFEFCEAQCFSEGLAAVSKNGIDWGYIDRQGNTVIKPAFRQVWPFSNGVAKVFYWGKEGMIDTKGNIVIPINYAIYRLTDDLIIAKSYSIATLYDKYGNIILPPDYTDIGMPGDNGLIAVKKDDNWGYVNMDNEVIIPFIFSRAEPFHNGVALTDRGYVNTDGELFSSLSEYIKSKRTGSDK